MQLAHAPASLPRRCHCSALDCVIASRDGEAPRRHLSRAPYSSPPAPSPRSGSERRGAGPTQRVPAERRPPSPAPRPRPAALRAPCASRPPPSGPPLLPLLLLEAPFAPDRLTTA